MPTPPRYAAAAVGALILAGTCLAQFDADCDGNGILDANEIALAPALDCNDNGVLDACEGAIPVAHRQLLENDQPLQDQWFGRGGVEIDGDTALVGGAGDGDVDGIVAILQRSNGHWRQIARLEASVPADAPDFGRELAIHEDTIAVGTTNGAVYIYERHAGGPNKWGETQRLTGDATKDFGSALALQNDTLAIGLPDVHPHDDPGAVQIYERQSGTWTPSATLSSVVPAPTDKFGSALTLDGDRLFVSTIDPASSEPARIVVRERNQGGADNWGQTDAIIGPVDPTASFGRPQDAQGDVLLTAASFLDYTSPTGGGKAFIYRFDGASWNLEATLDNPFGVESTFGFAVALDGDVAMVSGKEDDQGRVFVYRYHPGTGWTLAGDLSEPLNAPNDQYAKAIDIHDGHALVTADFYWRRFDRQGVLFCYAANDCNANGVPDDCDIADETSDDCDERGLPDECEDCNANGIGDTCETALGYAADCNQNAIPDSCEPDCNANGIPDDCDIADGTSPDANENGVPDECEPAPLGFPGRQPADAPRRGARSSRPRRRRRGQRARRRRPSALWLGAIVPALFGAPLRAQDCNANSTPDAAELLRPRILVYTGTPMDPFHAGAGPLVLTADLPAESILDADINLEHKSRGNYDTIVSVGSTIVAHFHNAGVSCNTYHRTIRLTADQINDAISDGQIVITVSSSVPASFSCPNSYAVCSLTLRAHPDCNFNGVLDSCDIAEGTVPDCNANGVPDACDVASGLTPDLNENGYPDDCDDDCDNNGVIDLEEIASGDAIDCNNDWEIDFCDPEVEGPPEDCDDPGAFALLTPANGATDVPTGPTLTWEPAYAAIEYDIEIASSPSFTSPIVALTVAGAETTLPDETLPGGASLYWRATARNNVSETLCSPALSAFSTVAPPPTCDADLDGDNDTDVFDFAIFAGQFGASVTPGEGADYDHDGTVTVLDFSVLATNFGCAL